MTADKEKNAVGVVAVSVIGAVGFATWQHSAGAGVWMCVVLFVVIAAISDYMDSLSGRAR